MRHITLLVFLSGLLCITAFADIYRWVDKDGRVHYSDKPAQNVESEHIEIEPAKEIQLQDSTQSWPIEISIRAPSTVGSGLIVPIFVSLDNVPREDPVKELAITLHSNPADHQKLIVAKFTRFLDSLEVSTQARMSGKNGIIEVAVISQSGQSKKQVFKCLIDHGARFSSIDRTDGAKGKSILNTEITPDGKIEIGGKLSHPMVPDVLGHRGDYVNRVEIIYRNELIAQMDWGDAVSKNPFIRLKFRDLEKGLGEAKVIWRDTDGQVYQAVK